MSATLPCPACGRLFAVNVPAGTLVECPHCRQTVPVPPTSGAAPPVQPVMMPYSDSPGGPPKQGLAVGALVCGIIGIVGCPLVGVVGIVLGIVALVNVNRDPMRNTGRGLAIGGICTGAASLLIVIPLMIAILLPSLSRAKELAKRAQCASNLMQIGSALAVYSNSNRGELPESTEVWQQRLGASAPLGPMTFVCPSDIGVTCSYRYVPGRKMDGSSTTIIVYEDPAIHNSEGGNVLFADGHVDFIRAARLQPMIDALGASKDAARDDQRD